MRVNINGLRWHRRLPDSLGCFLSELLPQKWFRHRYNSLNNYRWIDLTFTDSKSNRERRKWKLTQKNLASSARLSGTFVYFGETGNNLPFASSSTSRSNANLMNGQFGCSTEIVEPRSNLDWKSISGFSLPFSLIKIERRAHIKNILQPKTSLWEFGKSLRTPDPLRASHLTERQRLTSFRKNQEVQPRIRFLLKRRWFFN